VRGYPTRALLVSLRVCEGGRGKGEGLESEVNARGDGKVVC
jgi:hypothetical protein